MITDGIEILVQDVRYGSRVLWKSPGFTAVAVLTLALGIGANTTIFLIISAFFFQPLPVKNPDRLVVLLQKGSGEMPHGHSWLDYRAYRERVGAFEDAIATFMTPVHLSASGREPERAWIEVVSGNYFSLLGIEPAYGRLFQPGEGETTGADPVIVLSHCYWKRKFGGDPSIVGRRLDVNGHPFTVIGVTPEKFLSAQWSIAVNAFVPASMLGQLRAGGEAVLRNRGAVPFKVFARLKPGATLAQARAAVDVVAKQLATDFPQEHKGAKVFVLPERHCRPDPIYVEFMPFVSSVFMVLGSLVLLIACANIANLMFSRALGRQKELAIRTALGATRWSLIRQLLSESILMGVIAGGVGVMLAFWSAELLAGWGINPNPAGDIPVRMDLNWGWRIFAFTFLVSVMAGVVTGLAPALRATQLDVQTMLRGVGAPLQAPTRHPFRSGLVITQVAICLVVLVAGGLFVRSLHQVAGMNLGFRTDHLLMASLDLRLQGYDNERGQRFCWQLLDQVKTLPGVRSASLAQSVPFDCNFDLASIATEEKADNDPGNFSTVLCNRTGHAYLKTMGTPLLRGRDFTAQDNASAPKVAIVNALMAATFWPSQDPLGKRFRWGGNGELWQVVGVVSTGQYVRLGEEPCPYFCVPLAQDYVWPLTLVVWTTGDSTALAPAVRQVLRELDPHLPLYNDRTMEEHLRNSSFATMPLRLGAALAGMQGLLGLLLAVMGLYAVVSYGVGQRRREIGIRIALGAQKADILGLVLRHGLQLTLIGLSLGLAMALALAQAIRKVLYGLAPSSPPVFLGGVILLGAVAWLACYLPARRATKVDPLEALRHE